MAFPGPLTGEIGENFWQGPCDTFEQSEISLCFSFFLQFILLSMITYYFIYVNCIVVHCLDIAQVLNPFICCWTLDFTTILDIALKAIGESYRSPYIFFKLLFLCLGRGQISRNGTVRLRVK